MWLTLAKLLVPLAATLVCAHALGHGHGGMHARRTMLRGFSCNKNVTCPSGYTCMYNPTTPGHKGCFSNVNGDPTEKRAGRCPAQSGGQLLSRRRFGASRSCSWHVDCAGSQRCCPAGNGGRSQCVDAVAIDAKPTVTQLIEGRYQKHYGSSALVQAAGKNVLFDVGGYQTIQTLVDALMTKAGLALGDVDFIVVSHGHTDHVSNLGMFPDVDHNYWTFIVDADSPAPNALAKGGREYVLGNEDTELILSPGHTPQDIAMVVRGTANGTVVMSADTILSEFDATQPKLPNGNTRGDEWDASRKAIVCQADYVLPGHGPLFQVSQAIKTYHKC